jgi:hypothetical protein
MKRLPLSQGLWALIDDCDLAWAARHKWTAQRGARTYYAIRSVGGRRGRRRLFLHEEIARHLWPAEQRAGKRIDFVNRDGLDCRRANLRLASRAQDMANKAPYRNNTTGYKGVSYMPRRNRYQAHIRVNGQARYLGYYHTAEEAAAAYDDAAERVQGEFAWLNRDHPHAAVPCSG